MKNKKNNWDILQNFAILHVQSNVGMHPSSSQADIINQKNDRDRMGAYNAHKALMANLPFAEVPDDEFIKLVPKPPMNQQNKVLRRIMAINPNYDDCPKPREGIWSFVGTIEKMKLKNSALERNANFWKNKTPNFVMKLPI